MKKLQTERIDTAPLTVRPMSYNIPGHEARMKALERKVEREYLNDRKPKKA